MPGKMVRLYRSLYGIKQTSTQWNHLLVCGTRGPGLGKRAADACAVSISTLPVDDMFAM